MTQKILAFVGTEEDKEHLFRLKSLVGTAKVYVRLDQIESLFELELWAKQRGITGIFTTQQHLVKKLVGVESRANPSLDDYQGSLIRHKELEYVVLNPLEHLIKVNYAGFTFRHFVSKLTSPEGWASSPDFNWTLYSPNNADDFYERFKSAVLIGVDIETKTEPLRISCVSYSAVFYDNSHSSGLRVESYLIPLGDMFAVSWMRKFNTLPSPKVFQNGKYDNSYFLAWNALVTNWLFDTANAFHSWYSELPKDLGFLGAFFIRNAMYWKDLAKTGDLQDYYQYCCRDSWTTVIAMIEWLKAAPAWAKRNYIAEFPLVFPCLLAEMTGIPIDEERRKNSYDATEVEISEKIGKLQRSIGKPINPNSPKQVLTLLKILGVNATSSDEKNLKKAALAHPLNERLLSAILDIRKLRKLNSTYLIAGKDYRGVILFALNPHGTDPSRLASKEHHFWCGLQIQNIPRGNSVKRIFKAPEGFFFGEVDLEQAESRDTGYISGDETLINNVSGTQDFHSLNASAFFGISYEELYDDGKRKSKNKPIRDLAKRVNHGANYNMGANVLVDTMGIDKIREAQKLLNLPKHWNVKQVATYLLERFDNTYPKLKGQWYESILAEIATTHMLVSRAYHHISNGEICSNPAQEFDTAKRDIEIGGWTRYCFGRPDKNKSDLNSYVAHPPQCLNAQTLNRGYMLVYKNIAMNPKHRDNFRLLPQIHDSILFFYRQGHEYLAHEVKKYMEIPVTIRSADGKYRTFTVPAAVKIGNPGARYWNETGD